MEVLVRYGEIALKSRPVRSSFEKVLAKNVKGALSSNGIPARVRREYGRIFVETEPEGVPILQKVFGIVSVSPCRKCSSSLKEIEKLALDMAAGFKGTFAVKTRRVGSHQYSSRQVNESVGKAIAGLGKKVDLTKHDNTLFIEVRDKTAYLYTEKLPGPGGFPLGTQGKVAVLAGGSWQLAAWLFMKRGAEVVLISKKLLNLKPLEKWSFRPLGQSKSLDGLDVSGVVTTELKDMESLKRHGLPVYNPLMGMDEKEIRKMVHDKNLT